MTGSLNFARSCNPAMGFAQSLEKQVKDGGLTREQAIARFRDGLHVMRFDSANYILVQTFDGTVVIHGGDRPRRQADRVKGRPRPVERRPRARRAPRQ